MVKEKLTYGILEPSQSPYRSRYFLVVKKKPGDWRFINDVQPLNKVTIIDSALPPSVDEFSEDFAGYPISSAIDYFLGYFEIPLARESRDLTTFRPPLVISDKPGCLKDGQIQCPTFKESFQKCI